MTTALQPQSRGVGIAGTAIAHGAFVAAVLIAGRDSHAPKPLIYEVKLVAAPAASVGSRTVDVTEPPKQKPVTQTVKPKAVTPAPKPVPVKTKPAPAPVPTVKTPAVAAPDEKPSTGTNSHTLLQEGVKFPYPEYLQRIEDKVFARWTHSMFRPPLEARIAFVVDKDGSVAEKSYEVVKRSGNPTFDAYAQSAVEAAAARREFGPLPDGYPSPSLAIIFVFTQVAGGPQ